MFLLFLLFGAAFSLPETLVTYGNAIDFSTYAAISTFSCIKSSGYTVVFVRGYNPSGLGSFDNNTVPNIKNAYSAGIGTEVYMTPQPKSNKTAAQQFDELYNGLYNNGITVRTIWFQVTSPINWGSNASTNKNFISSLIVKAQNRGVTPAIYTSSYDWMQITGNWTISPSGTPLWYWNVYGGGVSGETPANFNDFRSFGGFTAATAKQYAQSESVCGLTVNRDVFAASASPSAFQRVQKTMENRIPVGGFVGLG